MARTLLLSESMNGTLNILFTTFALSLLPISGCNYCTGPNSNGSSTQETRSQSEDILVTEALDFNFYNDNNGTSIQHDDDFNILPNSVLRATLSTMTIDLNGIPTEKGETKEYHFTNQKFLLKERVVSVHDEQTAATVEAVTLHPKDIFGGWAHAQSSAFAVFSNEKYAWTLWNVIDGMPFTFSTTGLESYDFYDFEWLDHPGFLVELGNYYGEYDNQWASLLNFRDKNYETTQSLQGETERVCQTTRLSLRKADGTREILGTIHFGEHDIHQGGCDITTMSVSGDGRYVGVETDGLNQGKFHFLVDLESKSIIEKNYSSMGLLLIDNHPKVVKHSFDSRYTTSITNESQVWDVKLQLTVTNKKNGWVNGGKSTADQIFYTYDLLIDDGTSNLHETGNMNMGFTSQVCHSGWD